MSRTRNTGFTATPAIDRALHDIDELENDGDITEEMAQRARDAVGLLFDADTVYACIGPIDDGDVSFYWVAGEWSVSIDLGDDGSTWWRVVKGGLSTVVDVSDVGHPLLRQGLADFSKYVQSVNPAWREQPR